MKIGNQTQAGRMFDGLVRGAVFAQADGVVSEHMHHALFHQSSHAQGVARVVGKSQESAAKRQVTAVQRNTIHDRCHAELAHTVVDMAAKLQMLLTCTHGLRSEEHTSELQSLMRTSYAVFCLKKKKNNHY